MAFINKHSQDIKPCKRSTIVSNNNVSNNKTENKKEKVMDKISMVEKLVNTIPAKEVKRIKKDKGLIERTESSKTILTEDNKQLLVD